MVEKIDSGSLPRDQEVKAIGPLPAGHPPSPSRASACCSSISARPTAPISARCGAICASSCPTRASSNCRARIWYPILYGLVLTTRPQKSGANYKTIWNRRGTNPRSGPSPARRPKSWPRSFAGEPDIVVEWGMRYGNPSIASAVSRLTEQGCDRILTLPLYPQYSATTTATANDKLFRALMKMRRMPAVRSVPPYYDEPVYIEALASSIEKPSRRARFRAGDGPCLLSRHPEAPISRRATPITATARRRRGCCANGSAGTTGS